MLNEFPKEALDTPVMRQYLEIKSKYPDAILFFRMGDFYEMFLEDAKDAAKILDIALTKRSNAIPMAGIPYHSTESYISRLIHAGRKVVICEQTKSEDPKAKIMNREVVRIMSPGTLIEENLLHGFQNNFMGIFLSTERKNYLGLADISTSDLLFFPFEKEDSEALRATLYKFSPKEILLLKEQKEKWDSILPEGSLNFKPLLTFVTTEEFKKNEKPNKENEYEVLEHILDCYLRYNFRENTFSFKDPLVLEEKHYLVMDEESVRNLELVENSFNQEHTLFSVLNFCKTAIGKRTLKKNLLFPTRSLQTLEERWKAIEDLSNKKLQNSIKQELDNTIDTERIISRFRGGKAYPRDFSGILKTLEAFARMSQFFMNLNPILYELLNKINQELEPLAVEIQERIYEGELPVFLGNSPFLKNTFNQELDTAREAKTKGKDWILDWEEKEKKASNLSTLKVRFNKILGYYIEISRAQAKDLPSHYSKKQTLVGSERYTSPELEEMERNILGADAIIDEIEKREFDFLVFKTLEAETSIRKLSFWIGEIDFLLSLTIAKDSYHWNKPICNKNRELILKDCKHPVVEKFLPIGETFVPNSIHLDDRDEVVAILTGPNMAGKSTFMRQIAMNQILFQIGSYLPAKEAKLSIVDRIFTRIGSGDNLTAGESTFFLEMKETARILNHMTEDSLILFDEVGRGTSTYDGLSLAWAILEFLSERDIRTKTIFATHYHELTELEKGNGIFNLYMDTYEKEGEVLFLKKVKRGKVKKSFGIYVARLAGLPQKITKRAEEILEGLESRKKEIRIRTEEPSLFPGFQGGPDRSALALDRIRKKLQTLQIEKTTPLESMQILEELQRWSKE
ncbi:MAG: DNA mismatch repair protein MutS [Leptospiraceae bacterium]|nr:DNA mismatch repair protein MutS [Leptospiraceae bacterium]MCZ8345521.1 DNA mismatch repair protein MutS [Leptospiraceae bacterium]